MLEQPEKHKLNEWRRGASLGLDFQQARLTTNNSRWHKAEAHIRCWRRMGKQADGNKIHASFGVGPNIFEADAAGALQRNVVFKFRATLYRAAYVFGRHVVEKNRFCAAGERFFQFVDSADFNFNRLRASAVADGAL
jgi:hypothetical protein